MKKSHEGTQDDGSIGFTRGSTLTNDTSAPATKSFFSVVASACTRAFSANFSFSALLKHSSIIEANLLGGAAFASVEKTFLRHAS
jgi:hypothetical protein